MTNTSLQIGDVYALQEKETGKWFAFQIVQIGEENAVYIDLDYWSEMIPPVFRVGTPKLLPYSKITVF